MHRSRMDTYRNSISWIEELMKKTDTMLHKKNSAPPHASGLSIFILVIYFPDLKDLVHGLFCRCVRPICPIIAQKSVKKKGDVICKIAVLHR